MPIIEMVVPVDGIDTKVRAYNLAGEEVEVARLVFEPTPPREDSSVRLMYCTIQTAGKRLLGRGAMWFSSRTGGVTYRNHTRATPLCDREEKTRQDKPPDKPSGKAPARPERDPAELLEKEASPPLSQPPPNPASLRVAGNS